MRTYPFASRSLRIFILILVSAISAVPIGAGQESPQTEFPARLLDEMRKLQRAALEDSYAYNQVAHLCNNIGPRLSGSPQAEHAVKYVAEELRRLGLEVKLEKVMVPHWVRGEETAALVDFPGQAPKTTQKIVLTALGGSVATPEDGITAEVIPVTGFDELQSLGRAKVAGKIVLFNVKFDKRMAEQGLAGEAYGQAVVYRGTGASAAARLGAVASLIRSVGGADYRLPHTGAMRYADDASKIPAAAVSSEDADLISHLAIQGRVRMRLKLTPQTLPDVESHNVIADIRGSERPEEIVIVSGHLDSWDLGTGAIDDGAGVAVAMQAAHLIRKLGLNPKRTIRVIAWMNEENGLRGGRTYFQNHSSEIANHFAAIESDLGAGHPTGFRARVDQKARPLLEPVANVLKSSGAGVISFITDSAGADISPLENAGVPGFSPLQDERTYFNYHHTAADTLDKVNPHELAENAAVIAVLTYALANLPARLPR